MNKRLAFPIALVCAAAFAAGCTEARTADLQPPTPVKVQQVTTFAANNQLRYSATIRPASQTELAFKNGGFVASIYRPGGRFIDKGDAVAAGTVLARLRQSDFQDRLDQAGSQVQEARAAMESATAKAADNRARLERAELDFRRAETLFASQSLTKTNYDMAQAELESAKARVNAALADIESARARVRTAEAAVAEAGRAVQDTAITAPLNGILLSRSVELGTLMASGKPAFVVADTSSVKAVFGVPDLEIQTVQPGMLLDLASEALPEQTFSGRVTAISPAADEKSRIFETEVTIPNPKNLLKPGMIATVVIGQSKAPAQFAAVPLGAIVRSKDAADAYAVFVVEGRGGQSVARLRAVELGDAFGNMIIVTKGLSIGENIITIGATLIHDGSAVQIVP